MNHIVLPHMRDRRLIIDEGLIEDGRVIVLGLSGGPDSVCLFYELSALDILRRQAGGIGNPLICAHINHGLRGAEADGDEAFVSALCERFCVPAEFLRIDAASYAREKGMTVEEAGRAARYAFFDEIASRHCEGTSLSEKNHKLPLIAVAHNQDDQIETVFMRILRGTGIDGLAGMSKIRKSAAGYNIVRPMLNVPRKDIDEQLVGYGAEARRDASNADTKYFRNKIRIEVLPYLEDRFKLSLGQSLARLAENAAEDKAYFDKEVAEKLEKHLKIEEGCTAAALSAAFLANLHPAIRHRLIRAVFSKLGLYADIAFVHLTAADRLLKVWQTGGEASGKRVEFPLDYTFGITGKDAVFRTPGAAPSNWKPRRKP